MEVSITRADLETQIKNLQQQQAEAEQERKNAEIKANKILGALEAMNFMLSVLQQRERTIAELEAWKKVEEEKKKQAEIDAMVPSRFTRTTDIDSDGNQTTSTMIQCPHCGLHQNLREGKCVNALCFYHFKPNG